MTGDTVTLDAPITTATAIPAGWYTDPGEPAVVRWWTGEEWTQHVQYRPGAASLA
jgi:hypothetical protein